MINWRKPIIYSLFYLSGNRIPQYLRQIKHLESLSQQDHQSYCQQQLSKLLLHSFTHVPYYREILGDCKVVVNGQTKLENFTSLPILTKDIIRQQGRQLYADDYQSRHPYTNTSGGSTGEPVQFIQDKQYDQWNTANKLYFNAVLGKQPGQSEIKFWGSDRDILAGTLALKDRLINFLYNRKFFNAYRLGNQQLHDLVALNNKFRPKAYWSYLDAAIELARFIEQHHPIFHSPAFLVSTIGPMTEQIRNTLEKNLKCPVYDQYGSREVGAVACQCRQKTTLHSFPWNHHLEIIDQHEKPINNQPGRLLVTTLQNYSMPLIRYQIGDVAIGAPGICSCGRRGFMLEQILGRTLGYFKHANGSLVHSHFIVQALFDHKWIKRFQIIQTAIDRLLIRVEQTPETQIPESDRADITAKTKILMGPTCSVDYEFPDRIEPSPSGKYIYTICQVP